MRAPAVILCLVLLALAGPALAQAPEPVRVRGTIESFDGHILTVKTRDGESVALTLPDPPAVTGLEARTIDDIGQNDFIGTTAVKTDAGTWQALEVHIFPEAMRGAGEGHYAWDMPESTMTNAAVTGSAASKDGKRLTLTYKGGSIDVEVTADTKIVGFIPGSPDLLKPGAAVFALAAPGPDGTAMAVAVVAETTGVAPPM
jgi:hypothetical protein